MKAKMIADPLTKMLLTTLVIIIGITIWIFFFRTPNAIILFTIPAFIMRVIFNKEIIFLQLGRYNISLIDILSVYLLSIAITRSIIYRTIIKKSAFGIMVVGILLFVSWFRGLLEFGLELSTNDFRIYLYFFATLFYSITLNYSSELMRKIFLWITVTGAIIIVIAAFRWVLIAVGIDTSTDWIAPNGKLVRVISASAALLLLQISIFTIFSRNKPKIKYQNYVVLLLIIIILIVLQHRTVWAALLVSTALFVGFKFKHPIGIILGVLFTITLMVLLAINYDFSLVSLSGTSLDLSSLSWRVLGWKELLAPERFQTIVDYIIGQPFGTGYLRYLTATDYATTVSPHNFYVQTILNIGGIGFIILIACYGLLLKSLWKQRDDFLSCGFFILLSTQLVYYASYSPSYEQGFILGLAILFVQSKKENLISSQKKIETMITLGKIDPKSLPLET